MRVYERSLSRSRSLPEPISLILIQLLCAPFSLRGLFSCSIPLLAIPRYPLRFLHRESVVDI